MDGPQRMTAKGIRVSSAPEAERPSTGALAHIVELVRDTVPPMHPAGRPFVLGGVLATLVLRRLWRPLGVPLALLTGWCAWFFREPKRVTPSRPGVVVAPADGLVSQVVEVAPPAELGLGNTTMLRVSVFLSIFDVHVQRLPVSGEIRRIVYRPGKFLSADLDKASEDNERNTVLIRMAETDGGQDIVVVQIAGLIARRIVCSVAEGEKAQAGGTYGLIRFGSRVDTYLPLGSRVLVESGQRTIGAETVLAELPEWAGFAGAGLNEGANRGA
ncbi:MAG TPA: phosphatidylserine decarboxylase [Pseudonocardiaceae bacterium]|jgi:phosphatidylserine decarboxylase|nr:phosphatidylserine decarboxylase [Pseudonocardiaceae bacterium]